MENSSATTAQTEYIMTLAGKIQDERVAYLSQVRCVRLTQREKRGGMTKAEASLIIDKLKKRVEKIEEAEEEAEAIAENRQKVVAEQVAELSFEDIASRVLTLRSLAQAMGLTVPDTKQRVKDGYILAPTMYLDKVTPVWDRQAFDEWRASL